MIAGTDEILEVLHRAHEVDIHLERKDVWHEIQRFYGHHASHSSVYRAFDRLAEHGYIEAESDEEKWWRITEKGLEYLDGERDASED